MALPQTPRPESAGPPVTVRYEQAVYGSFAFNDQGYALLARSPGCREAWLTAFRTACQRVGERPAGVADAPGLFALRVAKHVWAVVGMSPQGCDDRGRPGALGFHALFVGRRDFRAVGYDPFALTDALRSHWTADTTTLPRSTLRATPAPAFHRGAADPDPAVEAAAAALARGKRVALESDAPADDRVRRVWHRLPARVRAKRSLATWAFGNDNGFDLLAVPRLACVPLDATYADPAALAAAPARRAATWAEIRWAAAALGAVTLAGAGVALALRGDDDELPGPEQPPPAPVATFATTSSPAPPATPAAPPQPAAARPAAAPARGSVAAEPDDADPAERRRVAEVLQDLADRCGVLRPADASADPETDLVGLMTRLSEQLRYSGPWLSDADRAALALDPSRESRRVRDWDDRVRRFAPDRRLPPDFGSGPLRWQLAALAWTFRRESDLLDPSAPRRSASELAQALADAVTLDVSLRPSPLANRYPPLTAYVAFLSRFPRR